jgi:RimJ/RimL family protein N-acetyltransferase
MESYIIREATPEDAAAILIHNDILANEPNNGIVRGPGENMSLEEERDYLAASLASDNSIMLIAVTPSGEVIGIAGFHGGRRKATRHAGGVGISVLPEWRDKGLGTTIMKQMIDWAKQTGIIKRVELEVMAHNERAIHVYEKLGFKLEGRKSASLFKDGRYIDVYEMGLLLLDYPITPFQLPD